MTTIAIGDSSSAMHLPLRIIVVAESRTMSGAHFACSRRKCSGPVCLLATTRHLDHVLQGSLRGPWQCISRACKRTSKTRDMLSCYFRFFSPIFLDHSTSKTLTGPCAMPFYCFTRKNTWSGPCPSSSRSTYGSRLESNLFLIWSKMPDSVPKCSCGSLSAALRISETSSNSPC